MSKGKPRYYPDKPANKRGDWCSHCEKFNGKLRCMYEGEKGAVICKGNPHNCMKVSLRKQAGLSEIQRDNGVIASGIGVTEKGNLKNPF